MSKKKYDSQTRALLIYMMLNNKATFSKIELEELFGVSSRTIDRDISSIKNAISEANIIGYSITPQELLYDKNLNTYILKDMPYFEIYDTEEEE